MSTRFSEISRYLECEKIQLAPLRESQLPAANRKFVDREEPQRILENAFFSIPNYGAKIRVFYGLGGQGKTALCREIVRKTTGALSDPAYASHRVAHLDLHGKPKTDPDLLLVWIRNEFAKAGVAFPCFDLALALMWESSRAEQPFPKLVNPWLGRSTKAAGGTVDEVTQWLGTDTAGELIGDVIGEIPAIGTLLKHLCNWTIEKSKRSYLERTREHLKDLYLSGNLKPGYELSVLLPSMLAHDLNFHLSKHVDQRFVLLIDEYERVFDHGGIGARWVENPFDRHIRELITCTNGLLCVFFSREALPWSNDPDWRDDLAGNQYHLEGLSPRDADDFLTAVPIADRSIRSAIIKGARETDDPDAFIYPLMLDLQLQHWRVLTAKGDVSPDNFAISNVTFVGRCQEMIERLLRDFDAGTQATIQRLSVCRSFDKAAFRYVVASFGTAVPLDSFDSITELSITTKLEDGFFAFHNVVAAALKEMMSLNVLNTTLEGLYDHYWSRAKVESHFDLDQFKIAALFEAAYLQQRRKDVDYFNWLAEATRPLYEAAMHEPNAVLWREAVNISESINGPDHLSTATCINTLGVLMHHMGDNVTSAKLQLRALEIVEAKPDVQNSLRCLFLSNLGSIYRINGNYTEAKLLLEQALAIIDETADSDDNLVCVVLNNLAMVHKYLDELGDAKRLYERAITMVEKIKGPNDVEMAGYLNNLAALHLETGEYDLAKPLNERALAICEKNLGETHPTTGRCLNNLGNLLIHMGQLSAARSFIERALAISEKQNGPEHPLTAVSLNNLASVLQRLGDYSTATLLFQRALMISENTNGANHRNTIIALENLLDIQQMQGNHLEAKDLYERLRAMNRKR